MPVLLEGYGPPRDGASAVTGSRAALISFAAMLFLPRIVLSSTGGVGVRVDDFVFLGTFLLLLAVRPSLATQALRLASPLRWIGLYVVWAAFCAAVGTMTGRLSLLPSMLYAIRPLQYACYIVVGMALVSRQRAVRRLFLGFAAGTAILGIVGLGDAESRLAGLTGGPYELAVLAGAATIFALYGRSPTHRFTALAALVAMVLTGSRVSLLGLGGVGLYLLATRRGFGRKERRRIIFALAASGLLLLTPVGSTVTERVSLASGDTSWAESRAIADRLDDQRTSSAALAQYVVGTVRGSADADVSALARYVRWRIVVAWTNREALTPIVGLGPSFVGPAIDGNYVRIYVETGVVGLVLLAGWFRSMWRTAKDPLFRSFMLFLAVSAVYIDVFASYKAMALLWVWFGMVLASRSGERPVEPRHGGRRGAAHAMEHSSH